MSNPLIIWGMTTLAVTAVSYTITRASIFENFRQFVEDRSEKLGELFRCPYCLSHWVTFGAAIALGGTPAVDTGNWVVGLGITVFAVICLVSLLHALMLRAYRPLAEEEVRMKIAATKMRKAAMEVAIEMGHDDVAQGINELSFE